LKAALDNGPCRGRGAGRVRDRTGQGNILFGNDRVVATPHLGASTTEAQENVALQVAEQISDYLLTVPSPIALNMPSISARKRKRCALDFAVGKLVLLRGPADRYQLDGIEICL